MVIVSIREVLFHSSFSLSSLADFIDYSFPLCYSYGITYSSMIRSFCFFTAFSLRSRTGREEYVRKKKKITSAFALEMKFVTSLLFYIWNALYKPHTWCFETFYSKVRNVSGVSSRQRPLPPPSAPCPVLVSVTPALGHRCHGSSCHAHTVSPPLTTLARAG